MKTGVRIFNIPEMTMDGDLERWFSEYGRVEKAQVAVNKATGILLDYGTVEMSSEAEANAAIQGLNGSTYSGKVVQLRLQTGPKDTGPQPQPKTGSRW